MTLLTWMKTVNAIKVRNGSKTKREKKKEERKASFGFEKERKQLKAQQGLRPKQREKKRAPGSKRK